MESPTKFTVMDAELLSSSASVIQQSYRAHLAWAATKPVLGMLQSKQFDYLQSFLKAAQNSTDSLNLPLLSVAQQEYLSHCKALAMEEISISHYRNLVEALEWAGESWVGDVVWYYFWYDSSIDVFITLVCMFMNDVISILFLVFFFKNRHLILWFEYSICLLP
jgi:hypothetical protein